MPLAVFFFFFFFFCLVHLLFSDTRRARYRHIYRRIHTHEELACFYCCLFSSGTNNTFNTINRSIEVPQYSRPLRRSSGQSFNFRVYVRYPRGSRENRTSLTAQWRQSADPYTPIRWRWNGSTGSVSKIESVNKWVLSTKGLYLDCAGKRISSFFLCIYISAHPFCSILTSFYDSVPIYWKILTLFIFYLSMYLLMFFLTRLLGGWSSG